MLRGLSIFGCWVSGQLLHSDGRTFIIQEETLFGEVAHCQYEVDPNSIKSCDEPIEPAPTVIPKNLYFIPVTDKPALDPEYLHKRYAGILPLPMAKPDETPE